MAEVKVDEINVERLDEPLESPAVPVVESELTITEEVSDGAMTEEPEEAYWAAVDVGPRPKERIRSKATASLSMLRICKNAKQRFEGNKAFCWPAREEISLGRGCI